MFKKIVLSLAVAFIMGIARGVCAPQAAAVLGPVVRVNPPGSGPVDQMWAYADPSDHRYMIVCGNQYDPVVSDLLSGYIYTTADAGKTWQRTLRDNSNHWVSEENCAYGSSGNAYYTGGVSSGLPHAFENGGYLHVFGSQDHGLTWQPRWVRKEGWVDWTYLQVIPHGTRPDTVGIFGNDAYQASAHRWIEDRPVALTSSDGGHSFSDVITSKRPAGGYTFRSIFAEGSVLLPDGTILFSANPSLDSLSKRERTNNMIAVFALSPSKNTLTNRPYIHTIPPKYFAGSTALARGTNAGRHHGRIYLAWEESAGILSPADLWLATSDDGGYHWLSRLLIPKSFARAVRLAVNNRGILGLAWSDNWGNVCFASSADGGETWNRISTVSTYAVTSTPYIADIVSMDERMFDESVALYFYHKVQTPYLDEDHLGLSFRVTEGQTVNDVALVADPKGAFHVFWTQPDSGNVHTILTRAIAVSQVPGQGMSEPEPLIKYLPIASHPAFPPPPHWMPFTLPGKQDVTNSIQLDFSNMKYNGTSHALSVDATLINASKRTILGPLSFIGVGMRSEFGVPEATNADGTIDGQPYWNATSVIPAGGLKAGARSAPLHLTFAVSNYRPLPYLYPGITGDMVAMHVRIYKMGKP